MNTSSLRENIWVQIEKASDLLESPELYWQLGIIALIYALAYILSSAIQNKVNAYSAHAQKEGGGSTTEPSILTHLKNSVVYHSCKILFPVLTIVLLKAANEFAGNYFEHHWLVNTAYTIAAIIVLNVIINELVKNSIAASALKWIAIPILFFHLVGALPSIITFLESISIKLGNISFSLYGALRIAIFGALLFWLGRASNTAGKNVIRRQQNLDIRTKEVAAKLFEIFIFISVVFIFLQIMGINLTTLAVFGGALGVGLGFGLQSIASNFISGVIILLDRSVSIGDYVEFEDGKCGIVREMDLRSTTLETFDGKDIVVPNEKFITSTFTNWTHKDKKQRYRVDFSVAYDSDIHKLVPLIKETVSAHEQVISGSDIPFEYLPDCEICSFGDSGINMFVEFWMEGIDDGRNRVGGDLLLSILDTLRENGYTIPFPQREVRVLDSPIKISKG
ncbi:mechanosensitive ion channel family protein [Teredinibacter sp. KSP-S5-2]|uniref:mechanosensitive ion channel family protein n=1 Tax=Teredinibacter sp. KSP-S5-2 TaxID=3034506 RepID=UPI002934B18B|nr:mechanosensitive ion channel domain-containing protein [Teredinibacter sp. KSP-S5-2]WNO07815.1 mechanosensitive ion channel [Teredinibacter sp. KSP-S5-2]